MTVLVGIETLLLVLIVLLVVGLLRSHAEILRRLEELTGDGSHGPSTNGMREAVDPPAHWEVIDIGGETLAGEPVKVALAGARRRTLLAFLSSGCLSCGSFWEALGGDGAAGLPADARVVVVVKDASEESPTRLEELAPDDVLVVMSSEAWERYRVAGSPYFILLESDGQVVGEGSAETWDQLCSLIRDAVGDLEPLSSGPSDRRSREPEHGRARLARADAELDAAGIGPGHPSLYGPDPSGADEGGPG